MSTATVLHDSVSLHPSPHRRRSRSRSRSRSISQGFDLTSRIGPKVTGHIFHHKTWVRPGLENVYKKSPKKESRRRGSYSSTDSKQGRNPLLEAFEFRQSHEADMDVDVDMEIDGGLDEDSTMGESSTSMPSLLARMEPIRNEDTSHDWVENDSNHGHRLVDRIASGGTKGPWQDYQRSEAAPVTTTPSRKNRQLGRIMNGNSDRAADTANHKLPTPPMPVSRESGAFSSPAATTSRSARNLTPSSSKADNANPNLHRMESVLSTEDGELRPLLSVDRSKDILATLVAQNLARRRENASPSLHPSTSHRKDYLQSEDRSTVVQFFDGEPTSKALCRQFIDVVARVGEEMEALRKRRVDAEKRESFESSSNPPEMPPSLAPPSKSSTVNLLPIDKDSQALIDLLYTPSPKTQRDDLPQSDDQRHALTVAVPPNVSPTDISRPSVETKTNTPPTIHISPPFSHVDMDTSLPTASRTDETSLESEDMVISPSLPPRAERLPSPPVDMELDSSDDDDGNPSTTLSKRIAALSSSTTAHASDMTAVADSDHEDGSIESSDESGDSDPEEGQLLDSASSTPTLDMFLHLPEERDELEAGDTYSTLRPILDVLQTKGVSFDHSEIKRSPGNSASSTETAGRKDVPGVWASVQCLPRVGQRPLVFHLADEMGAQWGVRRRGLHHSRLLDGSALETPNLDLGLGPILVPVVESDENRKRSRKAGKGEESEEPRTEYSHLQVDLACVQLKDIETIWDTFAPQFAEFAPRSRGGLKAKPVIPDVPNRAHSKRSRIALETAFVEALSQLEQRWPQPGELLVLVNDDVDVAREMESLETSKANSLPNGKSDGQAVYLGRDFDPSKPIPLAPHIRQGPNTIRIIQLAPLTDCVFVVFARGSRQGGFVANNLIRKEKKRKSLGGDGESSTNAMEKMPTEATPTQIRRAVNVGWLD